MKREQTQIVLMGARRFFMFIYRFTLTDSKEGDTAPIAASSPAATLPTCIIL